MEHLFSHNARKTKVSKLKLKSAPWSKCARRLFVSGFLVVDRFYQGKKHLVLSSIINIKKSLFFSKWALRVVVDGQTTGGVLMEN